MDSSPVRLLSGSSSSKLYTRNPSLDSFLCARLTVELRPTSLLKSNKNKSNQRGRNTTGAHVVSLCGKPSELKKNSPRLTFLKNISTSHKQLSCEIRPCSYSSGPWARAEVWLLGFSWNENHDCFPSPPQGRASNLSSDEQLTGSMGETNWLRTKFYHILGDIPKGFLANAITDDSWGNSAIMGWILWWLSYQ